MEQTPTPVTTASPKNKFSLLNKNVLIIFLSVIALIAAAFAYHWYNQFEVIRQDPGSVTRDEIADTIERVGKLLVLPEGEMPTVATVTDPSILKNQPFFAKAKMGDKVLIYTSARKAILYDPVKNVIVEVAPLTLGAETPTPVAPVKPPARPKR